MFKDFEFVREWEVPYSYDGMMSMVLGLAAVGMVACLMQLAFNKKRGVI